MSKRLLFTRIPSIRVRSFTAWLNEDPDINVYNGSHVPRDIRFVYIVFRQEVPGQRYKFSARISVFKPDSAEADPLPHNFANFKALPEFFSMVNAVPVKKD